MTTYARDPGLSVVLTSHDVLPSMPPPLLCALTAGGERARTAPPVSSCDMLALQRSSARYV